MLRTDLLSTALSAALLASGCSTRVATTPADGAPAAPTAPASVAAAPSAPASVDPAPVSASAAASAAAAAPSAAPSASASAEEPLPSVKVVNIGMHIGGGPNDAPTKEPIRRSVEPHFDAFRRCFALVSEAKKGDFGVDLMIDRQGGKAKVSHPRTALKGKPFEACVVKTFESIDFLKPKGGTTTVSYSLRFTP
jgi:hypothetical protein